MSCSNVVLPEPDVPTMATRSPFATDSSTPRRTSTLRPTSLNVLMSPRASRTGVVPAWARFAAPATAFASFIAQRLGRRLARGAECRIERRGNGERERQTADLHDLERPHLRWQIVEVVHLGGEQIDAEQPLQKIHDVAELPTEKQREQDAEHRADDADQRALSCE